MIIALDKKMNNKHFCNANTEIIPKNKTSTISIISTNNSKTNTNEFLKKIETPLDFIKQKKKFKMHDLFDKKGIKDFLASKEAAMEEIHLEDEIIEQKTKDNKKVINNIVSSNDSKNDTYIKDKNYKKTKFKKDDVNSKMNNNGNKKYINTEVKKNKTQKFKNKNKEEINNIKEESENNNDINSNSDNNILIIEKKTSDSQDSQDSNFLYRFIIKNANDSEDLFQKKLEKVIKKVETHKKKHKKEKSIYKSVTNKKKKSFIPDKKELTDITRYNSDKIIKKKDNHFIFSEKAKNLMINDNDIELSSIEHNYNIKNISPKEHSIKNNIKLIGKKENVFFGEEEREFINDNKDSIISIIEELE